MQPGQLAAGVGTQAVLQGASGALIESQGFGLAAGAVQGGHQTGGEHLIRVVEGYQGRELGDHVREPAEPEADGGPGDGGPEMGGVHVGAGALCPLAAEAGQWVSLPECFGRGQQRDGLIVFALVRAGAYRLASWRNRW